MSKQAPTASEVIIAELQRIKDAIIAEMRTIITAEAIESAKQMAELHDRVSKLEELLVGQKKAIKTTTKVVKTPSTEDVPEKSSPKLPLNARAYFLAKYKDAEYRKQFNNDVAKAIIAKDATVAAKPEGSPARYNAEAVALWKEYSVSADKTVHELIKKEYEALKVAAALPTPAEKSVVAEPAEEL